MSRIYVGNLPFQSQENSLRNLFAQYGTVREVRIITDAETGRSRGFAFVEMSTQAEAARAIEALDGQEFEGRNLRVNEARPREGGPRGGPRGNR